MIDSHCHLAGEEFVADLEQVVRRAQDAGVQTVLCILEAEEPTEVERAEVIRRMWPGVRFGTAVHPHHAGKFGDTRDAVAVVTGALEASGACAVGEVGLDYHYDFAPREVQQGIFRAQIRLAAERGLPVIIHTRDATADTLRILKEEGASRGVFHCFTGDRATADEALELGFFLSFAGIVTFPKATELREVVRSVPLDRILSETDAPYLAPVPYRGKRNEPCHVSHVVQALGELHGLTREAMGARIARNFAALFG